MKLPKEKRNQLVLAVIGTVGVLALMWFNLISPKQAALLEVAPAKNIAENKLKDIQNAIKHADTIASGLTNVTQVFSRAEDDMASGDLYSWIYDTIRVFKTPYRVDIPEVSRPEVSDVNLLPSFPFKQVKFTVNGTAYYHDLGKFIADFENKFPHVRVVDLTIQPALTSGTNDEKLSFKMDVIALVKPASL
jgi:Tfp pilus assembly protein PilO